MGRSASIAFERMAAGDAEFYGAKLVTARYFVEHVLPEAGTYRDAIVGGAESVLALPRGLVLMPAQGLYGGCVMTRESMEYDVVIVGAGPSGLSTAIRLRQLAERDGRELSVCVVEKGSEVGAHILSGAVVEPRALNELIPDWKERGAPLNTPVQEDRFLLLSEQGARKLPTPPQMHNEGNYIVSLGNLCRWLGGRPTLGVEIYPGFAAAEVLFDDAGSVRASPPVTWG